MYILKFISVAFYAECSYDSLKVDDVKRKTDNDFF